MKLRKKTLIIVGMTIISLVTILYAASQTILLDSFVKLEEQDTRQNVERVLSALSSEFSNLDVFTSDWAAWDDTYAFIEDANPDYVESNLVDETFIGAELNLMLFINSSGGIVFGKAFDLQNETEIPIPQSLLDLLSVDDFLWSHPDTNSSVCGIVLLPQNPLLIVSWPILTSEEEGPIRGALIMGYYLNSERINQLAETTHLSLSMYSLNDSQMPSDFQTALSSLSEEASIFVRPLNAESVAGYTLLEDIYGTPGLALRVDMARNIYKQGQASVTYFALSLLATGLVFGAVTMLLLEKAVLSRLSQLSAGVSNIGTSSNLSARVSITGRDELSNLADTINQMLAGMEQSHNQLRESRQKFERLFVGNPEAAIYLSPDFRILDVNPRFEELFGYSLDNVKGKCIDDIVVPKDKMEEAEILNEKAKKGYVYHDTVRKRKDGSLVQIAISAAPINVDQQPVGYVVLYKDISKLKETEKQLKDTMEKLHVVGKLTRHDVRNKLSTVTGNVFLAKKKLADDEALKYLKEIESASDQVERIFDFARTYEKLGVEELAYVDVEKSLEEAVSLFSDLHDVKVMNDCRGLAVLADSLLRQLLYNLIDNSLKHGTKVSRIKVHYRETEKPQLKLIYEDDGVGISKAEKEKIFQEGYGKDTGYGLYLIRKMCEVYGWTIQETGKQDQGAQFIITISKIGAEGKANYKLH